MKNFKNGIQNSLPGQLTSVLAINALIKPVLLLTWVSVLVDTHTYMCVSTRNVFGHIAQCLLCLHIYIQKIKFKTYPNVINQLKKYIFKGIVI